MDYQATFTMAVTLTLFFATSLLYVWKTKHPSRSLWISEVFCFVFLVGTPFVAGYFLAGLLESASFALGYIFQMEPNASTAAAKVTVTILAVFVSLPAFYIGRQAIQTPAAPKIRTKGALHGESFATNEMRAN